ncbi:ABC transporter permease [Candidatus Woesearchaeota archaeon]|nr:ABC transporter permease [Candidatus Woesearchaeota archaeon]
MADTGIIEEERRKKAQNNVIFPFFGGGVMFTDYLKIAVNNIRKRKLRSWLTMIGIFIGIAAVVAMISLGQGMRNSITEQFEAFGIDKITIMAGGGFFGIGGSAELTTEDLDVIKKSRGVAEVTGFLTSTARVEFGGESKFTFISGVPTGPDERELMLEVLTVDMADGKFLGSGDTSHAVIGYLVGKGEFFEKPVKVGDKIVIAEKELKVIGIIDKIGNPNDDTGIIIDLELAREIYDEPDRLDAIMAQVTKGTSPSSVAENIEKDLRKHRDVEIGEEDFNVLTTEQLLESFNTVLNIVTGILIGIASISLLVGGVGIMNTMYTSVLERTSEIGVMKAIGARNSDILKIFLTESAIMGIIGGAIGVVIGVMMAKTVELAAIAANYDLLKVEFTASVILGSLFFSTVVGTLSGFLPARQASSIKPVDALRYE